MDNIIPLFYSDLFVKENVGTEELREDLKRQILQAKKDDRGTQGGGNPGCWRSTALYEMKWLYDEMRNSVMEANQKYSEIDFVFKQHLEKSDNLDYNIWTNVMKLVLKMLYIHIKEMHGLVSIMFKQRIQATYCFIIQQTY